MHMLCSHLYAARYRNNNAVNRAVTKTLTLEHDPATETFIFDSSAFFPLDDEVLSPIISVN